MKIAQWVLAIVALFGGVLVAQDKLPIIKANSTMVDIKDGGVLARSSWTIDPQTSPDIYTTSSKNKKVVFYTDIDSISVKIKKNTEFNFIVLLNDSIEALTQIKYEEPELSYLEILKKGKKYNVNEEREMPNFTYQEKDNENLVRLRREFKLDSIAGTGNEISQILNLLNWMHNLIPHDGYNENPKIKNAMDMIAVCKRDNRGLNCRGLATALNECYLAMGFKSRYITCMPKNENGKDRDCHVINVVYSNDLDKWIWVDPTHASYVMNEKGELLGPEEVRDRLIHNKPLILNPEANWNRKESTVKDWHLDIYMAKNLYMLQCPIGSQYDTETHASGKTVEYVTLMPLDYKEQKPYKHTSTWTDSKTVYYKTNNPDYFWQKP